MRLASALDRLHRIVMLVAFATLLIGAGGARAQAQACNNYTLVYTGAAANGTDGQR